MTNRNFNKNCKLFKALKEKGLCMNDYWTERSKKELNFESIFEDESDNFGFKHGAYDSPLAVRKKFKGDQTSKIIQDFGMRVPTDSEIKRDIEEIEQ